MRGIEVIVSPIGCSAGKFSVPKGTWVICGEDIHRHRYVDPSEALKVAMEMRGPKRSVIIRPNFNETHLRAEPSHPSGYREWRSFGGGALHGDPLLLRQRSSGDHGSSRRRGRASSHPSGVAS